MNWLKYLPLDDDIQHSTIKDFYACSEYSAVHIAEMVLRKQTGTFWDFSERALAKLAGNGYNGNSLQNVVNAINQYGLISEADWPSLEYANNEGTTDWNTYYATVPPEIIKRGFRFQASVYPITASSVTQALNSAPVWIIIQITDTVSHCVALVSPIQYWDSYDPFLKTLNYPVLSYWSLQLKPLFMMPIIRTVRFADNKTMGIMIDTSNGVQIIKATDENQWRSWSKPDSYGKPTVNQDGTTNWNADLQLNF